MVGVAPVACKLAAGWTQDALENVVHASRNVIRAGLRHAIEPAR
jgi:hypothetical protein